MSDDALIPWLTETLGRRPQDERMFVAALTHGSHPSGESYERLEFLGDQILGVLIGEWLYALFPAEPEGKLSSRLHALVSGATCAGVARAIGVGAHVRLGKQARDDGAADSDYVLGDVIEALVAALYLEGGLDPAREFVRRHWASLVQHQDRAPKHPKAALQEWAAEKRLRPPVYTVAARTGPHHAPRFTVQVEVPGRATASAEGTSKQEAETAAARVLLAELAR